MLEAILVTLFIISKLKHWIIFAYFSLKRFSQEFDQLKHKGVQWSDSYKTTLLQLTSTFTKFQADIFDMQVGLLTTA